MLKNFMKKWNFFWRKHDTAPMTAYYVKCALAEALNISIGEIDNYINIIIEKRKKQGLIANEYAPKLINNEISTDEYINAFKPYNLSDVENRVMLIANWKLGYKIQ